MPPKKDGQKAEDRPLNTDQPSQIESDRKSKIGNKKLRMDNPRQTNPYRRFKTERDHPSIV